MIYLKILEKIRFNSVFYQLFEDLLKKKFSIRISKRYRFYFCYIMFLGKVEYNHEWSFTVFASKIDSAITFEYRFFSFHLICMRYEYISQQKKNPTYIKIEEMFIFLRWVCLVHTCSSLLYLIWRIKDYIYYLI